MSDLTANDPIQSLIFEKPTSSGETSPAKAEPVKAPESQPTPVPTPAQDQPTDSTNNDDTTAPIQPPTQEPQIIDKRTGNKELKKVSPNADSLTTIADQDEEEFIKEVEKHHATNI
jgi:hypothetical protein